MTEIERLRIDIDEARRLAFANRIAISAVIQVVGAMDPKIRSSIEGLVDKVADQFLEADPMLAASLTDLLGHIPTPKRPE